MKSASKMLSVSCLEGSLDLQRASNARIEPMQSPVTFTLDLTILPFSQNMSTKIMFCGHLNFTQRCCTKCLSWDGQLCPNTNLQLRESWTLTQIGYNPQIANLISNVWQKGKNQTTCSEITLIWKKNLIKSAIICFFW